MITPLISKSPKLVKLPLRFNPYLYAISFASLYLLYCLLYIWLSSEIAASFAFSIQQLTLIEQWKGTIFVILTTLLIFLILIMMLKRIDEYQNQIFIQQSLLIQSERKATAGIFAASVAHDMNNCLFSISGAIEVFQETNELSEKQRQLLRTVETGLAELTELSRTLVHVEQEALEKSFSFLNLNAFIQEIIELAQHHQHVKKCAIRLESAQLPNIMIETHLFKQMLINMIINAAEAIQHANGIIVLKTTLQPDAVILEIHDNGRGIPQDLRQKVFEPFFTTKTEGSGLGLLSVKVCMDKHNGSVKITDSDLLGGCCIRLTFPIDMTHLNKSFSYQ
ncbi:signal transduction histidine kinase [Beggiatoa alba B18LD]|uniref:histidine kinase n=1 Tax=Beggiatoa alba B18LD TaxID=395493 RepID=I3CGR7_9GAMM|nr:ATP-binding protein [Beggiatoa alba]EIJ42810.1 signal transduction histidine kinase [Beggiatoa alba B18LD]